jgi:hypothetical protein
MSLLKNRSTSAAAAAVVLGCGLAISGSAPAQAEGGDQRGCVTYGEYTRVRKAQSMRSVMRLVDARGHRISSSSFSGMKSQMRKWRPCPGSGRFGSVIVQFDDYTYGSDRRGGPMEATMKDMTVVW